MRHPEITIHPNTVGDPLAKVGRVIIDLRPTTMYTVRVDVCTWVIGEMGIYSGCFTHGGRCPLESLRNEWLRSLPQNSDGTVSWPNA